jgi:hypothetical protein
VTQDEHLRNLERQSVKCDGATDEPVLIGARVRAGLLLPAQLLCAAYCGNEAAGVAVEELELRPIPPPPDFETWAYLGRTGISREDHFAIGLLVASLADQMAISHASRVEADTGFPAPDSSGRSQLLEDLSLWVDSFRQGQVGPVPKRRRLSPNLPADLAVRSLREAVTNTVRTPLGNSPEVSLRKAISNAAEVIGEESVKRVIGERMLSGAHSS